MPYSRVTYGFLATAWVVLMLRAAWLRYRAGQASIRDAVVACANVLGLGLVLASWLMAVFRSSFIWAVSSRLAGWWLLVVAWSVLGERMWDHLCTLFPALQRLAVSGDIRRGRRQRALRMVTLGVLWVFWVGAPLVFGYIYLKTILLVWHAGAQVGPSYLR